MSKTPSEYSSKFPFSNADFNRLAFFVRQWSSEILSFANSESEWLISIKYIIWIYLNGSWCCLWYLGMVYEAPIPHGPNQHISLDHVRSRTSGAQVIEPLLFRSFKSSHIFSTSSLHEFFIEIPGAVYNEDKKFHYKLNPKVLLDSFGSASSKSIPSWLRGPG